jgi:branched-chain amino acid transport system permease protein
MSTWLINVTQATIDGLIDGGIYAWIGLGLSLSFITLRRLNLAYGATALFGIYGGLWLHQKWDLPLPVLVVVIVVITLVATAYVELLCFRGRTTVSAQSGPRPAGEIQNAEIVAMAASFAIWMQLEQVAVNLLPRHLQAFPSIAATSEWAIGEIYIRYDRGLLAVVGLLCCWLTAKWLAHSRTGLRFRAATDHSLAARLSGLRVDRVQRHAFYLAGGLSAVAACSVLLLDGQVTPMFGMWMLFKGLVAAWLLGGHSLGSVMGGGLLLGLVESYAQWLMGAQAREFVLYALLFVLLVRQAPVTRKGLIA